MLQSAKNRRQDRIPPDKWGWKEEGARFLSEKVVQIGVALVLIPPQVVSR
jgi:hypothetical protein